MTRRFAFVALMMLAGCASGGAPDDLDGGDDVADAPSLEPDATVADAAADGAPGAPDANVDAAPCVPATEACNGFDDDCDGMTDEGFPGVGADCDVGVGACEQNGTTVCTADGTGVACSALPGMPSTELCGNGLDEDCDGMTDEGFPEIGTTCSAGVGACMTSGPIVCGPAGTTTCSAVPGTAGTEACNGLDDDCDGTTDDGFGLGSTCDGGDGDMCAEGTTVCNMMGVTTCSDATGTTTDVCNGVDDDCNPATADGAAHPGLGAACDGGDGDMCVEGVTYCAAGSVMCNDLTGTTAETCNNADDDCDAAVDETWPLKGTGCTAGMGACAVSGTYVCTGDGSGIQCNAVAGTPGIETCGDGIDADCSGGADPSCPINDLPASPFDISAGGTFTANLQYAHDDIAGACSSTGGRDVFYQFNLSATQVVYADTIGSDFDSVIRIRNGTCSSLGAEATCQDDACAVAQSQLAVQLAAGTYCLVVDQFSGFATTGNMTLKFTPGGRTGTAVALGVSTVSGDTTGQPNTTTPSCGASNAPDVAYYFLTCPGTRTINVDTCNAVGYDTVLNVRQGAVTSADLICNDDDATCAAGGLRSRIAAYNLVGANLNWIMVDGYSTNFGPFVLNLNL